MNKPEKNEILINLPKLTSWTFHLKYLNEVLCLLFVYIKVCIIIIIKIINNLIVFKTNFLINSPG